MLVKETQNSNIQTQSLETSPVETFKGSGEEEGVIVPEEPTMDLAIATPKQEVEMTFLEEGEIPMTGIVIEKESSRSGTMNNLQGQDHTEVTTDGRDQEETKDWKMLTDLRTPTATKGTTQETKETKKNTDKKRPRPL